MYRRTSHLRLAFFGVSLLFATDTCCSQEALDQIEDDNAQLPTVDELLLFFPSKFPAGDWTPGGLQFKDVFFSSVDQTRLHGWFCPCDNPRAIILIAHGNAGHVASRAPWLSYLQSKARVAAFMFDYRGYGRSEGIPSVHGALDDARAARAKLRELANVKDSQMLLMGESLGGAIVVQLAAESAPRGLILQSTFSSLKDVADVHFPRLSWLVPPTKLNSEAQITDYSGPLLQSHGTADRVIPFELGKRLFEAANEPKTFLELPAAWHNDWLTDQYLATFDDFIGQLTPKPSRVDDQVIHEPEAKANENLPATAVDDQEQSGSPILLILVLSVVASFGILLVVVIRRRQRRGTSVFESHQ